MRDIVSVFFFFCFSLFVLCESLHLGLGTFVEGMVAVAGRLRAFAVFSAKPDPILTGVPDFKALKHDEVPLLLVYGIFATPPKTPPGIVAILDKAVKMLAPIPNLKGWPTILG